jgi:hypothetical protein
MKANMAVLESLKWIGVWLSIGSGAERDADPSIEGASHWHELLGRGRNSCER